jgi:hypothetical protein
MEQTYVGTSFQYLAMSMFRQSTMRTRTMSDSTSTRNKHVGKSYREICMWSWTQVSNTEVLLLTEVRKEGRTMSNPVIMQLLQKYFEVNNPLTHEEIKRSPVSLMFGITSASCRSQWSCVLRRRILFPTTPTLESWVLIPFGTRMFICTVSYQMEYT